MTQVRTTEDARALVETLTESVRAADAQYRAELRRRDNTIRFVLDRKLMTVAAVSLRTKIGRPGIYKIVRKAEACYVPHGGDMCAKHEQRTDLCATQGLPLPIVDPWETNLLAITYTGMTDAEDRPGKVTYYVPADRAASLANDEALIADAAVRTVWNLDDGTTWDSEQNGRTEK